MSEQREYRMLSDWYEDLAGFWLGFGQRVRESMAQQDFRYDIDRVSVWEAVAHRCTLRAGRYARMAEKAKAQHQTDLTNVTPIKAKNQ